MSDEPNNPMIEALRDRKRQIELDLATTQARLEEVQDLLAILNSPRRGRPRRPPPPPGVEPEQLPGLVPPAVPVDSDEGPEA